MKRFFETFNENVLEALLFNMCENGDKNWQFKLPS